MEVDDHQVGHSAWSRLEASEDPLPPGEEPRHECTDHAPYLNAPVINARNTGEIAADAACCAEDGV